MPTPTDDSPFDWESFWEDVADYRKRFSLHVNDIAEMAGISVKSGRNSFAHNFKFHCPMSLASICRIAKVCDLALDKYNRAEVKLP